MMCAAGKYCNRDEALKVSVNGSRFLHIPSGVAQEVG